MRTFSAAQVDNFIPHLFERLDSARRYIINISKIPALRAVAEKLQRLSFIYPFDKPEYAHIRPSGRSVNSKITQHGYVETEQVMIRVSHCFGCLFSCGIR